MEFKRSTAELREGMQTVCAFLNGSGGMVVFGVGSGGFTDARRTPQVTPQVVAVLQVAAQKANSRDELQKAAGIKDREHFRTAYLLPLLSAGWLERIIPDKPRSRMQRYRTTEAGREAIAGEKASARD